MITHRSTPLVAGRRTSQPIRTPSGPSADHRVVEDPARHEPAATGAAANPYAVEEPSEYERAAPDPTVHHAVEAPALPNVVGSGGAPNHQAAEGFVADAPPIRDESTGQAESGRQSDRGAFSDERSLGIPNLAANRLRLSIETLSVQLRSEVLAQQQRSALTIIGNLKV